MRIESGRGRGTIDGGNPNCGTSCFLLMGLCSCVVAPEPSDIDNETLTGLSVQSEQSTVSSDDPNGYMTLVVAYNDTQQLRDNFLNGDDLWKPGTPCQAPRTR